MLMLAIQTHISCIEILLDVDLVFQMYPTGDGNACFEKAN